MQSQDAAVLTTRASRRAGDIGVHKELGGGSFIAGIKRIVSPHDELDAEIALGTLANPAVHQDIFLFTTFALVHEIGRHLTAHVHFSGFSGMPP